MAQSLFRRRRKKLSDVEKRSEEQAFRFLNNRVERNNALQKAWRETIRDVRASYSTVTVPCLVCGSPMEARRRTKRTCSAKCRKRLERDPEFGKVRHTIDRSEGGTILKKIDKAVAAWVAAEKNQKGGK